MDQYQEHLDYEAGCMSDLQNAFARSRQEIEIRDDRAKVRELVGAGKFVVVSSFPVLCPSTDAFLGEAITIEGVHETREAAMAQFGESDSYLGDVAVWVEPRVPYTPPPVDPEVFFPSDCPF